MHEIIQENEQFNAEVETLRINAMNQDMKSEMYTIMANGDYWFGNLTKIMCDFDFNTHINKKIYYNYSLGQEIFTKHPDHSLLYILYCMFIFIFSCSFKFIYISLLIL